MTVIIAFYCVDGVVVAADSMITATVGMGQGAVNVGHHHGVKVFSLPGPQVFAFAGDQGQAMRFKALADAHHAFPTTASTPLDYPLAVTQEIVKQFISTGIQNSVNLNVILAFLHGGLSYCCAFEGLIQPRLLDSQHYYVALGSGKLSADPFLRFLDDIFCQGKQPNVREAIFLATWAVQHVIDVNPGGVAGPIRIAVFEKDQTGVFTARELPDTEMEEPKQAVESAGEALRDWRKNISGQGAPEPMNAPPEPEISSRTPPTASTTPTAIVSPTA